MMIEELIVALQKQLKNDVLPTAEVLVCDCFGRFIDIDSIDLEEEEDDDGECCSNFVVLDCY